MSSTNRYTLPTGVLPAISIEVAGAQPLVGIMSDFGITANGVHQVFPYCTYLDTDFDTYTIVRGNPGSLQFSGVLVSTAATLQSLFGSLADTAYSATRIEIINPETLDTLADWDVYDYRLGGFQLKMHMMANHTMVLGTFVVSFRKLTDHA